MSDTYFCRLVDAEGQPVGQERRVLHTHVFNGPGEAAEFFASELVDEEMRDQRVYEDAMGHWHEVAYTIDVRHPDETDWHRYQVVCRCKFEFTSRAIEAR